MADTAKKDESAILLASVNCLKSTLVRRATGDGLSNDNDDYVRERNHLMKAHHVRSQLPDFVQTCRDLSEFWGFIKQKFSTYQERRDFLRDEFDGLLTMLEDGALIPVDASTTDLLSTVDSNHVRSAWAKALDRRESDPDGAITAARTLLETVCKHILDDLSIPYSDAMELPRLYGLVAKSLNLSPSQHSEKVFKMVLGGCHAVVEGIGSIRNKLSDAHGRGKRGYKPAPRHASLTVNLAGTMASFLVETWESQEQLIA